MPNMFNVILRGKYHHICLQNQMRAHAHIKMVEFFHAQKHRKHTRYNSLQFWNIWDGLLYLLNPLFHLFTHSDTHVAKLSQWISMKRLLTYSMLECREVKHRNIVTNFTAKEIVMPLSLNCWANSSAVSPFINQPFSIAQRWNGYLTHQNNPDLWSAYPLLTIPLPTCRSLVQRCQ